MTDSTTADTTAAETPPADTPPEVHLYVLLDRSGSMQSMADDVIGGFNRLLADQRADGDDARMTLVQFDGEDPQEVLADAVPIAEVYDLDRHTFVPRGSTPLLDATGLLLARASERATQRAADGEAPEEILFATITDGHENASKEYRVETIRQLVAAHQLAGWTFVFLGAGLDVYGEAVDMGYSALSVQSWEPDEMGVTLAMESLSGSTTRRRAMVRDDLTFDSADFFAGAKPAEEDRMRRRGR